MRLCNDEDEKEVFIIAKIAKDKLMSRATKRKAKAKRLVVRSVGCGLILLLMGGGVYLGYGEKLLSHFAAPVEIAATNSDLDEEAQQIISENGGHDDTIDSAVDEQASLPELAVDVEIKIDAEKDAVIADTENNAVDDSPPTAGPPVYTKCYNDGTKRVYLTIDDGPSASTEALLDVLKAYGVKATFFMLEPNMECYEASLVRLVEEGHMPGMHGVTHRKEKFYLDSNSVLWEMQYGQNFIKDKTGKWTSLIRVPYGSKPYMKPEYRQAVKEAGLSMWDWNVDSLDWKFKSEEYVTHTINQVVRLTEKQENPVILIHDTPKTAEYLPKLLDYLIENGYEFVLIDDATEPVQFPE